MSEKFKLDDFRPKSKVEGKSEKSLTFDDLPKEVKRHFSPVDGTIPGDWVPKSSFVRYGVPNLDRARKDTSGLTPEAMARLENTARKGMPEKPPYPERLPYVAPEQFTETTKSGLHLQLRADSASIDGVAVEYDPRFAELFATLAQAHRAQADRDYQELCDAVDKQYKTHQAIVEHAQDVTREDDASAKYWVNTATDEKISGEITAMETAAREKAEEQARRDALRRVKPMGIGQFYGIKLPSKKKK